MRGRVTGTGPRSSPRCGPVRRRAGDRRISATPRRPAPDGAVRGYFAALQRGDAPAALAFGDVPKGVHTLLTDRCWPSSSASRRSAASRVVSTAQHGDRATVRVRYTLGVPGRRRSRSRTTCGCGTTGGAWHLVRAAVATKLYLPAALQRATIVGRRHTRRYGADVPGRRADPASTRRTSQLDPATASVSFASPATTEVTTRVSHAGRRAVTARRRRQDHEVPVRRRRGPAPNCPLPAERYVPGTCAARSSATPRAASDHRPGADDSRPARRLRTRPAARPLPPADVHQPATHRSPARIDARRPGHRLRGRGRCGCSGARREAGRGAAWRRVALACSAAGRRAAAATPGPEHAPEYWFDSWHVQQLWDAGAARPGHHDRRDRHRRERRAARAGRTGAAPARDFGERRRRPDRPRAATRSGTAPRWRRSWSPGPGLLDITGLAPDAQILPLAVPLNGTTDSGRPDQLPDGDPLRRRPRRRGHQHVAGRQAQSEQPTASPCPDDEQRADLPRAAPGRGPRRGSGQHRADDEHRRGTRRLPRRRRRSARSTPPATSRASPAAQPYLTLVAPGVSVPSLGRDRRAGVLRRRHEPGDRDRVGRASRWLARSTRTTTRTAARRAGARHPRRAPAQRRARPTATGCSTRTARSRRPVPADAPNPVYDAVAPFLAAGPRAALEAAQGAAPAAAPPRATHRPLRGRQLGRGCAPRRCVTGGVLALVGLLALVLLLVRRHPPPPRPPRVASVAAPRAVGRPRPTADRHRRVRTQLRPASRPRPITAPPPRSGSGRRSALRRARRRG